MIYNQQKKSPAKTSTHAGQSNHNLHKIYNQSVIKTNLQDKIFTLSIILIYMIIIYYIFNIMSNICKIGLTNLGKTSIGGEA
jgi:hypothetical protein